MKQKDFLIIFGSAAVVVILWIGFTIYNNFVTSSLDPELISDVRPITPNFDEDTLTLIRSRQQVEPVYSLQSQTSVNPTPSISAPTTSPVPSIVTPTPSVLIPSPSPSTIPVVSLPAGATQP